MQIQLPFRRISVVGLGYIGLPTAAMFASRKIEVVGVDVNPHAVDTITASPSIHGSSFPPRPIKRGSSSPSAR